MKLQSGNAGVSPAFNWMKFPLLFLFFLTLVFYTVCLLENQDTGRLHLTATLSLDSQIFYTNLEAPLSLTYIGKHLNEVKKSVRILFARLKTLAPNHIDDRIVDSGSESGRTYAIKKKAAPFHVRDIQSDEYSEQAAWSSLVIAYGDHPEILIPKIVPSDIPYLEHLILAHIKALTHPPRPIIAVFAPQRFGLFTQFLGQSGDIVPTDSNTMPSDADIIFWIDPATANPRVLQNAIDKGRPHGSAHGPNSLTPRPRNSNLPTHRKWLCPFSSGLFRQILTPHCPLQDNSAISSLYGGIALCQIRIGYGCTI